MKTHRFQVVIHLFLRVSLLVTLHVSAAVHASGALAAKASCVKRRLLGGQRGETWTQTGKITAECGHKDTFVT